MGGTQRLVVGAVITWLAGSAIAFACSFGGPEQPQELIPGLRPRFPFEFPDAGSSELPDGLPLVPRNVAFMNPRLHTQQGAAIVADGAVVQLDASPVLTLESSLTLVRAPGLLDEGAVLQGDTLSEPIAVVSEQIDETPPQTPSIVDARLRISESSACGNSSCDGLSELRVDLDAVSDDTTPERALFFAVFIGRTRQQVLAMETPSQIAFADDGRMSLFPPAVGEDEAIVVTVAAIDLAGRISERARPFVVDPGGECSIGALGRSHTTFALWVSLALLVLRSRRRGLATSDASEP